MPLIEPEVLKGRPPLREKLLIIGAGGAGKTSIPLNIAWWAKQSEDTRQFYYMDTDDEAVLHTLNEEKYEGLLAEDGGNVHITSVINWDDYVAFSQKAVANAKQGDFIVLDFITHAWTAAQEGFLQDAAGKTRGEVLYEAGVGGASGWDMFKTEFNWNAINGSYFDFIKPILLKSKAHVIMLAEEEQINTDAKNITADNAEHAAQFGKWKAVGQKKLPYQCRSYLRVQRLARGRVLHTLKDRARRELKGETMSPDFVTAYLRGVAGWGVK